MDTVPKTTCLRCGGTMLSKGTENLQLRNTGFVFATWNSILSNYLEAELFVCVECGKMEFYASDRAMQTEAFIERAPNFNDLPEDMPTDADGTPQRTCPYCGIAHDFDYPKCPHCNYVYQV